MSTSARSSSPGEIAYRQGRLFIERVALEEIAARVGTPVYAYSAAAILARYREVDAAFASRDHLVCYALKANPNRAVCRLIAKAGGGAEVVSGGELRRALAAGFPPSKIVFSGVGKTEEELRLALKTGVLTLNVESEEELALLSRLARSSGRRAPVSVRINPGVAAGGHRHLATGHGEAKFGVEPAQALQLCRRAWKDRALELKGLHCHIGSQILSPEPYRAALKVLGGLLASLAAQGVQMSLLDLGGGLGIRYEDEPRRGLSRLLRGPNRVRLQAAELAAEVLPMLAGWPDLDLVLEPGRFLTAESGVLLTTILYRKRIGRSRFLVVDAGMNDLARPTLYDAYHPVVPARLREAPEVVADVVGPVCETGDVLARSRRLPWLPRGEVLAVLKAGAYGFSMASQYNSRPRPPEVLVDGDRWRVIRAREGFDDLIRHER